MIVPLLLSACGGGSGSPLSSNQAPDVASGKQEMSPEDVAREVEGLGYATPASAALAVTPAAMTTPANGSTFTGENVTFTWAVSSPAATVYYLYFGTAPGKYDLGAISLGPVVTYDKTHLPINGSTVYVRLYSFINGVMYYNDYSYFSATIAARRAAITSPANNSVFTTESVAFTWIASIPSASVYTLSFGSAQGLKDLGSYSSTTAGSYTHRLPTNALPVWVRLSWLTGGVTYYDDYSYTAANITVTPAVMTSPASGATLTGNDTFTWTASTPAADYYVLCFASNLANITAGTCDLGGFNNYLTPLALTYTKVGLPADGAAVYVRLKSFVMGKWYDKDYTYATAGGVADPAITSPAVGSTIPNNNVPFTWTASSPAATLYEMSFGTAVGLSDKGICPPAPTIGALIFTCTTGSLNANPKLTANTLYVRLRWQINAVWYSRDYTYLVGNGKTPITTPAAITTPANGSALTGVSDTFTWTASSPAAVAPAVNTYTISFGTTLGGSDLGSVPGLTVLTYTKTGLPRQTVYVRLSSVIGAVTYFNDYTYVSPRTVVAITPALMTTPTNGATLAGASDTFTWAASSPAATKYYLYFGTALGKNDWGSHNLTGLTYTKANLPLNGATVYVRLWSNINSMWYSTDSSYIAANTFTPAAITSPAVGPLTGNDIFTWSASTPASTHYIIYFGTAPGEADLGWVSAGTALTYTKTGLPTAPGTVYVRLLCYYNSLWYWKDTSY
jgi:hypothetical protein